MSARTAMTTAGPVAAADLGLVLPHEHLYINELREDRANGLLNDAAALTWELAEFAAIGGRTIVELTTAELTAGAAPDPLGLYSGVPDSGYPTLGTRTTNSVLALADLSRSTGVNLILGTGNYRDPYLSAESVDQRSADAIAERMVEDLTTGFPGTDIRAGIIGEVGADKWHISAREERSIRAAARAHRVTGAAVTTHSSKWPVGGLILDVLCAEGVDPSRVIVGHCSTIDIPEYHLDLARRGAYVQFDTIRGGSARAVARWVEMVLAVVRAGYLEQVLLSHDVCLKDHLRQNGGCGFTYVPTEFVAELRAAGMDAGEVDLLLGANAHRAICG